VILDDMDRVLGEGITGPSNPLRVGITNASAAIREAVDKACATASVKRADIVSAVVGLAGVRREDIRARMRDAMSVLTIDSLDILTDAEIALFGATGGAPGLVIIAGTGSICCGKNLRGKYVCAGGWGPIAGDEGSGSWIARKALQMVARSLDGRGDETVLAEDACAYFNVTRPDDLSTAIYAPNMTNNRIAGFATSVIEAARNGDAVSNAIVSEAGRELADAAIAVIKKLKISREHFRIGYVGGVFTAGELLMRPLRERILQFAPGASLSPPFLPPAVAAARMARVQLHSLALAG
jgi:N-acetylglucosamine kinase-like BadF-type ATPase